MRGRNNLAPDRRGIPHPNPLARFAEKCAFDPVTGCVMWVGTVTAGHGHHVPYGRFWYKGKFWLAHRWSGVHIHGLALDGLQADHCCPAGPSTLCVEHVAGETLLRNRELQHLRPGRPIQSTEDRQHWLFVSKGLKEYQPAVRDASGAPFYSPPDWLRPFLISPENDNVCPF